MSKLTPQATRPEPADFPDEAPESDFKPLTAEEARRWRERHPPLSPWRVVGIQAAVGSCVALLAWWVSGRAQVAWSAGYGALAVVLPAALFARGLTRQSAAGHPGAALAGLLMWELVKIALTVAMLFAAPRLIAQLSWLALVVGFVVTMKVYWVAMWFGPGRRKSIQKI